MDNNFKNLVRNKHKLRFWFSGEETKIDGNIMQVSSLLLLNKETKDNIYILLLTKEGEIVEYNHDLPFNLPFIIMNYIDKIFSKIFHHG